MPAARPGPGVRTRSRRSSAGGGRSSPDRLERPPPALLLRDLVRTPGPGRAAGIRPDGPAGNPEGELLDLLRRQLSLGGHLQPAGLVDRLDEQALRRLA